MDKIIYILTWLITSSLLTIFIYLSVRIAELILGARLL
jgi:hypothetical protein